MSFTSRTRRYISLASPGDLKVCKLLNVCSKTKKIGGILFKTKILNFVLCMFILCLYYVLLYIF